MSDFWRAREPNQRDSPVRRQTRPYRIAGRRQHIISKLLMALYIHCFAINYTVRELYDSDRH